MSYADWAHAHDHQRRAIAAALERFPVDVVHMHGVDFADYLPAADVPVLATLHLPPGRYKPAVFTLDRRALQLQCVSPAQRRECPASPLLGPEIENGVPVARLEVREPKRGYAVALGRICPEKGFHLAIAAARSAHAPLRLAGRVFHYEDHERYFAECIAPLLDAERCYVGPVRLPEKAQLLAGARCLLVPSLVHETSGLVAMEAMAAGTPVIAFRTGALPDIIEQGVTGFLVDDAQQMAEAIAAAGDLDPEDCRAAARERFSADRMIARYLERYRQLAGA
jgi:glycosyltransferase involved in cell wall biosynthesis